MAKSSKKNSGKKVDQTLADQHPCLAPFAVAARAKASHRAKTPKSNQHFVPDQPSTDGVQSSKDQE